MTTPAVSVQLYRPMGTAEKRLDAAGNVISQSYDLHSVLGYRRIRPESKLSPIRSDGTRAPRSWSSQWLHSSGFTGTLSMKYSPGSANSNVGYASGNLTTSEDPDIAISTVTPLVRNARLKALAKVTADTMQFNAALSQMDDTLKLVGTFSTAAAKGLDDMMLAQQVGKNGKKTPFWKTAGKLSSWKKIPDRYLAYLYGIAPLGDDLANATSHLVNMKDSGLGLYLYLKASESRTESVSVVTSIHNGSSGYLPGIIRGTREMQARVGYRFDVPRWFLEKCPVVAPFSTAYELMRMSFVLDWIAPIGNWVGALESAQFSPFFKEGWETAWIQDKYRDLSSTSSNKTVQIVSDGELITGMMSRAVLTSYPSSVLTRPALNPVPSWSKAAQGLSLLTQAFKRWY